MAKIEQDQVYHGDDWWDWSVWISGSDAEISQIKEVVWHLHPTFSPSKVVKRNPAKKFILKTSGWGTFQIKAELKLRNGGESEILRHKLKLYYEDAS